MSEGQQNQSRRSFLRKVGLGLVAFVPAAQALLNTPTAHAYAPCADSTYIRCTTTYQCYDGSRLSKVTTCRDTRNNDLCSQTRQHTNVPC